MFILGFSFVGGLAVPLFRFDVYIVTIDFVSVLVNYYFFVFAWFGFEVLGFGMGLVWILFDISLVIFGRGFGCDFRYFLDFAAGICRIGVDII